MRIGTIYLVLNIITNARYVGKCLIPVKRRWHVRDALAGRGKRRRFYHAIRKYGEKAFRISTIANIVADTKAIRLELSATEQLMIAHFHSCVGDFPDLGYNMTRGGEGGAYFGPKVYAPPRTEAAKLRSIANLRWNKKGNKLSLAHRKKITQTRKARGLGGRKNWSGISILKWKRKFQGNTYHLGIPHTKATKQHFKTIRSGVRHIKGIKIQSPAAK